MSEVSIQNIIRGYESVLEKADIVAKEAVVEQMIKDTDEFVPYANGRLAKSVRPLPNGSGYTYSVDYASYAFNPKTPQGRDKKYSKLVHPKAQGLPYKAAENEHYDEWVKLYKEAYERYVREHT